jgi:hypothetical protein
LFHDGLIYLSNEKNLYDYIIIFTYLGVNMKRKMKLSVGLLSIICVVLLITPACTAGLFPFSEKKKNGQTQETSASQYWALLFAVGVYEGNPDADRPEMLESCDNLYTTLTDSPEYWQASNIHTVKASQATLQNLIKELLWLRKNAKSEDYVLVYLTTHGNHLYNSQSLPWDLPPKDESDGSDEILMMYNGWSTWYGIIWDDLLNFFLSLIKCQGLCLIVDSCYSGGFNDPPYNAIKPNTLTADAFMTGFVEDLATQRRVILMSSLESEVSYGTYFSDGLIGGFQGWGDFFGNGDGINSAEEAYDVAKTYTELLSDQTTTIADGYPGEFPVTT